MRIITTPYVHVLSIPTFNSHPEYELPEYEGNDKTILNLIAEAGKVCYDSYGKDGRNIQDHIRNLRNTKHGSVFEHANISLQLSGISRGLSHELVRHRHFAYSQRSTRYTNEEEAAIVLDPFYTNLYQEYVKEYGKWEYDYQQYHENLDDAIIGYYHNHKMLIHFVGSCFEEIRCYAAAVEQLMKYAKYQDLFSAEGNVIIKRRKWARGKARQLLPHALETRMVMTGNIRAWRWLIELRSEEGAEPEIRRLMFHIFTALSGVAPLCFEDFRFVKDVDNYPILTPSWSKI